MGNTLHRHMSLTSDKITFEMKASIVEGIIGSMFREDDAVTDSGSDSEDDVSDTAGRKVEGGGNQVGVEGTGRGRGGRV